MDEARAAIRANLGADGREPVRGVRPAGRRRFHRPGASARTTEGAEVAVKVLRPGVEKRFAADLASFYLRRAA